MTRGAAGWLSGHRLLVAALCAALLLPVVGVAYLLSAAARRAREQAAAAVTLPQALDALDRDANDQAEELARILAQRARDEDAQDGGPEYVLGVVAARRADILAASGGEPDYARAVALLAVARDQGYPPERAGDGQFQLGRCLLQVGRVVEARAPLTAALSALPERQRAILPLLIRAYVEASDVDVRPVLAHLDAWLALPDLPPSERERAQIDRARILFRLGDFEGCRTALDQIQAVGQQAGDVQVMRARLLMHSAAARLGAGEVDDAARAASAAEFQQALTLLQQLRVRDAHSRSGRESMFLIGRCQLSLGDNEAALSQFRATAKAQYGTPEGEAARIEEGDLLLAAGRDDAAIVVFQQALESVPALDQYRNPWITIEQFRERMAAAYRHFVARGAFGPALALAQRFEPLFPAEQATRLRAEAHRGWGRGLLAQAAGQPPAEAEASRQQGREQLRLAGQAFARLATLRYIERDYPDQLWTAAECCLEGQDYAPAARLYQDYLDSEGRRRRPAALLGLGESLMGQGRIDAALSALSECIDRHAQDSASFRARVVAAQARFERGEVDAAEALLRQNIEGDLLTPASQEWRDSLFALGWLLHFQKRWSEAIVCLDEAVERYPDAPASIEARYLIAHACGQEARGPQQRLAQATADSDRVAHAREMQRLLLAAVERYEAAIESLVVRQESLELEPEQQAVLRNCYFGKGAALFDLGRYEEAIQVYSTAANRYHHSPVALEAYARIAACYRKLDRPVECRGILARARIVLRRLPEDSAYTKATNYDRKQWGELLDWLGVL
jgi:tetratricopeptide (TPR) repeat protein